MSSTSGDTLKDPENEEQEVKSVSSNELIDQIREKQLLRKLDLHLLPIICVLYFVVCISRNSLSNAMSYGISYDLRMSIRTFSNVSLAFFIPHVVLIIPSNIFLKNTRPSIYLPFITTASGLLIVGSGVTRSTTGLYICQSLQGAFDAGVFPGLVYLLATFYPRTKFQLRLNCLFTASFLANAVNGLLANGIARMSGVGGYRGWRWICILEGIATVVVGVLGFFFVGDWPETARFLGAEDRRLLHGLLALDHRDEASMDHLDMKAVLRIVTDVKIWLGALMYFSATASNLSLSWFTSLTIRQLHFTGLKALALSIPLWATATIVVLTSGYASDRLRHRYAFVIAGVVITSVGYALLFNTVHIPVGARYFSLFVMVTGMYLIQPITIGWLSGNLSGRYKRGVGVGFQIAVGSVSGLMATAAYRDPPYYHKGLGLGLGMIWACALTATVMFCYLRWENRARDQGKRDGRYRLSEREKRNLGDDCPEFRFLL